MAYDKNKNGIWAAFGNRYDLRYYENKIQKIEIVEKPGFFREYEARKPETGTLITGRALKLVILEQELFYFYEKDRKNNLPGTTHLF